MSRILYKKIVINNLQNKLFYKKHIKKVNT